MELQGWSDEAVAAAATEAGAAAACLKMGRPPSAAGSLRAAAGAEIARRASKRRSGRRTPAPVSVGREPRLRVLTELLEDPMVLGILALLAAGLRMLSAPWRPRQRPAPEPEPEQEPELDGLDADDDREMADALDNFMRMIERGGEINTVIAAARLELPFDPPFRLLCEDLADYAEEKIAHGGRLVPVHRLSDPGMGLPATALAVLNASAVDRVKEWHRELLSRKWQRAPRRSMLLRLHQEGLEILKAHPLPSLGRCEAGPPRGIWPPAPAAEVEEETKAPAGGRKLGALATLRPPA